MADVIVVVKAAHVAFISTSFALFCLRGYWMFTASERLGTRLWSRWLPDAVDSLLLASGITLVWLTEQYPGEQPWLTVKLSALVVYIILGSIAIRRGKTRRVRVGAWLLACLVFAYIVGVAVTRNPASWLALA